MLCARDMPDREASRMILAFRCALGTDLEALLHKACKEGDIELVKLIIASEQVKLEGLTVLRVAATVGNKDLVELLLSVGTSQSMLDLSLVRACSQGHVDIARMLLDAGADIHTDYGLPLELACQEGRASVVELLVERGVALDKSVDVISLAVSVGHANVLRLLLDNVPDIDEQYEYLIEKVQEMQRSDIANLLMVKRGVKFKR